MPNTRKPITILMADDDPAQDTRRRVPIQHTRYGYWLNGLVGWPMLVRRWANWLGRIRPAS